MLFVEKDATTGNLLFAAAGVELFVGNDGGNADPLDDVGVRINGNLGLLLRYGCSTRAN